MLFRDLLGAGEYSADPTHARACRPRPGGPAPSRRGTSRAGFSGFSTVRPHPNCRCYRQTPPVPSPAPKQPGCRAASAPPCTDPRSQIPDPQIPDESSKRKFLSEMAALTLCPTLCSAFVPMANLARVPIKPIMQPTMSAAFLALDAIEVSNAAAHWHRAAADSTDPECGSPLSLRMLPSGRRSSSQPKLRAWLPRLSFTGATAPQWPRCSF